MSDVCDVLKISDALTEPTVSAAPEVPFSSDIAVDYRIVSGEAIAPLNDRSYDEWDFRIVPDERIFEKGEIQYCINTFFRMMLDRIQELGWENFEINDLEIIYPSCQKTDDGKVVWNGPFEALSLKASRTSPKNQQKQEYDDGFQAFVKIHRVDHNGKIITFMSREPLYVANKKRENY